MKLIINWEAVRAEAVKRYAHFVDIWAPTTGVEAEYALEVLWEELIKNKEIEVNKPEFLIDGDLALGWQR